MGEFLAMSGVSRASRRDVLHSLEEFALATAAGLNLHLAASRTII